MPDGEAALRIAGIALLTAAMAVAVRRLLGPFRLPRGGIGLVRPKEDEPSDTDQAGVPAPGDRDR